MTTQLATAKLLDKLRAALSLTFPASKVDELLDHYSILRKAAQLDQYETCLVNGGKFVEAVLKCLFYSHTKRELDSVKADDLIRQLENATSLSDFERLTIPRILRAIYELRNKRGGAHNSSFNPLKMDCVFIVSAANWVVEELARIYLTSDALAAQALVANLLTKDLPLLEKIDGDYLVLDANLAARIQLELILYSHYPERCLTTKLIKWVHNHSVDNVRSTLRAMRNKNLVHETESGWKLTLSGVREAEEEIAKLQAGTKKNVTTLKKKKGINHARRTTRK